MIWRTPVALMMDPETFELWYILDCRHTQRVSVWRHVNYAEKVPIMGDGLGIACHACMEREAAEDLR